MLERRPSGPSKPTKPSRGRRSLPVYPVAALIPALLRRRLSRLSLSFRPPRRVIVSMLLTFPVVLAPVSGARVLVITGFWCYALPFADVGGPQVRVVEQELLDRGLLAPEDVRKAVREADTIVLVYALHNAALASALADARGKRVYELGSQLPLPYPTVDLTRVLVRWGPVEVPLAMYVQCGSLRNYASFLRYFTEGRPGPFHPLDGWVEGYDLAHDRVVRPRDPDPRTVLEAVRRYGTSPVRLPLSRVGYPAWLVNLVRERLPGLVREVVSEEVRGLRRAGWWRDGEPATLVIVDSTALECGWNGWLRGLARRLLARGVNAIVLGFHYDLLEAYPDEVFRALRDVVREYRVRAIVYATWMYRMRSPDCRLVRALEELGVPVIKAIRLSRSWTCWTMSEWNAYWQQPWSMDFLALYHVVIPENVGMIEGIPVTVAEWRGDGPEALLGRWHPVEVPVSRMLDLLASRVVRWVDLSRKPNAEKRVVILYWAHHPGKEGVGTAIGLDVPASIVNFLAWLLARGYRVEIPREFVEYLRRFADEVPSSTALYEALRGGTWEDVRRTVRETLLEINRLEVEAERLAGRGEWKRALELYLRAYRLIRPLADALARLLVDAGSNVGAYVLRRLQCSRNRLYLEVLAYRSGRFVRRRVEVPYAYLMPLEEYLRYYRRLPLEARLCMEKGIFGYVEAVLRFIQRYGPVTDVRHLQIIEYGLDSLRSYVAGHLQYVRLPPAKKAELLRDLSELIDAVRRALTEPGLVPEALRRCEELYRKWSRVEALYGWFTGWGPPERSRYLVEVDGRRYFVIRGVIFGNVFIGPQPARGYYTDVSVAYHSTVLPMSHYYLACYLYYTRVFRADVIVNTGKHGTYEWLPYKPLFMSWWDFPQVCIQDVPQVYPYYVADPSEALVAKRRGWAVLVNYLPESLARCE
ncbi:MAG: cobaltochelatase subunit CobN, partial [Euryarchaeota archaeon]